MLCDECNQNDAIYSVSVLMGDEVVTRHLCPSCMSKMNQTISASNIRGLLSSILTAITGSEAKTGILRKRHTRRTMKASATGLIPHLQSFLRIRSC